MTSEHADKTHAKTIAIWILCAIIGLTFIGAAVAKFTYTVQLEKDILSFFNMLEAGWNPYVAVLARLLIVVELGLGLALLQPYWRKRLVLPLILVMLAGFAVYLFTLPSGVDNCGCMGSWVEMTPKQSLIKNIVLLILGGSLMALLPRDPKGKVIIPFLLTVVSAAFVFGIIPVKPLVFGGMQKDFSAMPAFQGEARPLKDGTALLCFFSATCEHCMETADALASFKSPDTTLYFAINGSTEEINTFREELGLTNVPYLAISTEDFLSNIGDAPPRVYLLKNGKAVTYWDGAIDRTAVAIEISKLNK